MRIVSHARKVPLLPSLHAILSHFFSHFARDFCRVCLLGCCPLRFAVADVLRVVPDSSVLIETDMHAPTTDAAGELLRVCGVIAKAKGISIDEAVTLANKNAARFLSATEGRAATGHDTVADVV